VFESGSAFFRKEQVNAESKFLAHILSD
jgi:hypothetical protein